MEEVALPPIYLAKLTWTVLLAATLFGCVFKEDSPMDVLASNTFHSDMDERYWIGIDKTNPDLFEHAMGYCSRNPAKPNCDAVREANFDHGDIQH